MITIKSRLKKTGINLRDIHNIIAQILRHLTYEDFDIGVLLTTNSTIRKYNKLYRGKDKPTDILSFAYHPHAKPGKRIKVTHDEDKNLGDLIISPEYIKQHPEKYEGPFDNRLTELLVHGICHLLGYDHEKDSDYRIMRRKEQEILRAIGK